MNRAHLIIVLASFFIAAPVSSLLAEDHNEPQQSTTGPVPPKTVLEQDKEEMQRDKVAIRHPERRSCYRRVSIA